MVARVAGFAVILLVVPAFAGCADVLDRFTRPDYDVSATNLAEGDAWNTENRFRVLTEEGLGVRIRAEELDSGELAEEQGITDVTLVLPDGRWSITYWIEEQKWNTLSPVRIDTVPPRVQGLETLGDASSGRYILGEGVILEPNARMQVFDLQRDEVIATRLPVTVEGLTDGLHAYLVSVKDVAGNYNNQTVQVRVGAASSLPAGQWDFGVIARYNNDARLWPIEESTLYLDREAARAQVEAEFGPGAYLGSGFGIAPDDPVVKDVANALVTPDMNTLEAARILFLWMFDNLRYDNTRLETNTLLTPDQVILDTEDPGADVDEGLVPNGSGNGVKGGVCRDLAATYVSLLRAVGVPARLVSGYLAEPVNGFHAWVEFYGGPVDGAPAWIPVDVSTVGAQGSGEAAEVHRTNVFLQSFGAQPPEYLALRAVPPGGEVEGWSTALSMEFQWPSGQPAPKIRFQKQVETDFHEVGVMCVNPETHARALATDEAGCQGSDFTQFLPNFIVRTQKTIDYGVDVQSASPGTKITARVAYPFEDSVAPDSVEYRFYGEPLLRLSEGKAEAVIQR